MSESKIIDFILFLFLFSIYLFSILDLGLEINMMSYETVIKCYTSVTQSHET